jgi:DNA-binding NtrC family response regulator
MTLHVLIVDDDDHVRSVLGRLLVHRGYTVHTASGAESAYALLCEHVVDAVLMDLNMPDVPGETLFFALVARWPYLRGHIAIMSGNIAGIDDTMPSEVLSCPRLAKPFTFEQLESVIAGLVHSAERRQQNGG